MAIQWSQIFMIRGSFLHKGFNSFLKSLGSIERIKYFSLQSNTFPHSQIFILLYSLLGCKQSSKRFIGDLFCNVDYLCVQISSREHLTDNTQLIGPFRINEFRSKHITISINFSSNTSQSTSMNAYLWVPPIPGMRPSLSSGSPNLASSEQKTTSARRAISNPPPRATPFTPAMIGFLAL